MRERERSTRRLREKMQEGRCTQRKLPRDRTFPPYKSRGTWESNNQLKLKLHLSGQTQPDQNTGEGISTSSTSHPHKDSHFRSQLTHKTRFRLDKSATFSITQRVLSNLCRLQASVTFFLLRSNQIQFITIDVDRS